MSLLLARAAALALLFSLAAPKAASANQCSAVFLKAPGLIEELANLKLEIEARRAASQDPILTALLYQKFQLRFAEAKAIGLDLSKFESSVETALTVRKKGRAAEQAEQNQQGRKTWLATRNLFFKNLRFAKLSDDALTILLGSDKHGLRVIGPHGLQEFTETDAAALSPDGRYLSLTAPMQALRVVDLKSRQTLKEVALTEPLLTHQLIASSDGRTLLVEHAGGAVALDAQTFNVLYELRDTTHHSLSADGQTLFTNQYDYRDRESVLVMREARTGFKKLTFPNLKQEKFTFIKSAGDFGLIGTNDAVIIWSPSSNTQSRIAAAQAADSALSPNGKTLAIAERDRVVLRDFKSGELLTHIPSDLPILSVAFMNDRQLVLANKDGARVFESQEIPPNQSGEADSSR